MRFRKQDLSLLLLHYLGYSKIRNLVFRVQGKPVARFLVFHDIPPEEEKNFHDIICFLKENTNVVSLDDYFAGQLSNRRVNVVITFDDGYKSWATKAGPALKKLGLPATFFVSSGFLDLSRDAEAEFVLSKLRTTKDTTGGLTSSDLRGMVRDGFTIGGHTLDHVNLGEITDEAEARRQISEDKRNLESIAGQEIRYFAYPFGADHNPELDLIALLKEAGYRGAVTTIPGFNTAETNHHRLFRELSGVPMRLCVLKARVLGAYDGVSFLKSLLRRRSGVAGKSA